MMPAAVVVLAVLAVVLAVLAVVPAVLAVLAVVRGFRVLCGRLRRFGPRRRRVFLRASAGEG
jgi:hypothetical protein